MWVLLVTDVFPNKVEPNLGTFTLERLRCMKKIADVRVVAPVPWFPRWRGLSLFGKWHKYSQVPRREVVEGVEVYHPRRVVIPKVGGVSSGIFYRKVLFEELKRIAGEFAFDVIDAHFVWPDGYAALKAGQALGVPVCITAHGTDVNFMPRYPLIKRLIVDTVKNAHRIVAVSQALADIVTGLGAPSEKVKVIHNGVDLSRFRRIETGKAREELGIEKDVTLLLSIGALIPRKGHEYLIDGMNLLVNGDGMKSLRLVIVGQGEQKQKLEGLIREQNLQKNVTLQGAVPHEELYRWLSASDFFCLTSSREGWPTVLFEAWACGVPVLATAAHGTAEAVCSEKYGLLMERQDADLVAEMIKKAMGMTWNPEDMMSYAAGNSWEEMVKRMHAELEAIRMEHAGTAKGSV
jgi:glycosyltransferase involved in cell wall biosynthesis